MVNGPVIKISKTKDTENQKPKTETQNKKEENKYDTKLQEAKSMVTNYNHHRDNLKRAHETYGKITLSESMQASELNIYIEEETEKE